MRVNRYILLLLLFSAFAPGITLAQFVTVESVDEPVSIAGQWLFKDGDNLDWSAANLDVSDWNVVTVPDSAPAGFPEHRGMGWYRVTVQLDPQQINDESQLSSLSVLIGAVESAYELYAGGELIGGVGQLPPQPVARYNEYKVYRLPRSAIDDQGQLVIALRVWRIDSPGAGGTSGPYEGPFLIGDSGELSRVAVQQSIVPSMLMATLYFAIGLYHLFIARRNPTMKEFFWFGLFAIALSVYSMETSQWRFNIDISFLLHLKIEYTVLYIMPYLAAEVMTRIARIPVSRILRIFKLIFLLFALVVAVIPTINIHYLTLPYYQYLAALWALFTAASMGWHASKGNREAGALTALLLILVVSLVNDLFLNGALLGTADTIYIVFALTILLMAVIMANHYTATLAKLEQSVEERTADLLQTNQKLEDANAIKEQFLANMSHELRTPMNAIIGLTHLGMKTDLDEQQRDYLTKVDASAANLLGIIDSVLDFSKLQSGELEVDMSTFDLKQLLEEMEIATLEQATGNSQTRIRFSSSPELPLKVKGDRSKLATVLRNLISNAVKFTPTGEVSINVKLLSQNDNKVSIEFSVSDTGIGISKQQQEQLFEGFSQAESSFNRAYGGTGLGLATAQQLVELMGGNLTLQSDEGKGSCFSFCLELVKLELKNAASASQGIESETEELDLSPIRGATILIVDDSEINLQIASEILQQAGFRVDNAHDGQQAVDMINNNNYDCVLMDLQMPVMDGFEATETIRANEDYRELPILAVTANFATEDKVRASNSGMNAHIPKPIEPQQLFKELLQWIPAGDRAEIMPPDNEQYDQQPLLQDELPGLKIHDGLNRVGGNTKLYLNLLQDMKRDYSDTAHKLRELIENDSVDLAGQLAHKLRGIANNLGASDIGLISGEIEKNLKKGNSLDDSILAQLETELSTMKESIEQLLMNFSSNKRNSLLDEHSITRLLDQISEEIAQCNPAASETVETLLAGLEEDSEGMSRLIAVSEALDIYDFDNADKKLIEVKAVLV